MHSLPRRFAPFVIAVALLAAGAPLHAQEGHNPFATPSAADPEAGGWELVDERDLDLDGELVTLSPDGRHIAGIGPEGNQFCVWEVATGDAACEAERQPVLAESIAWAPDSSAVAYALDALIRFYDSDVFVFELDEGRSVNLTDDEFDDGIPISNDVEVDALPVDVYPAWTPDGQSLVFVRTDWLAEQPTTELMTIAREGSEPELLHTVRDDFPFAISSPVFPLADGAVLYSVFVNEFEDPGNGLWRLDPTGDGDAEQLVPGAEGERFPIPAITDVREDGAGTVISGYSRVLANDILGDEPIAFELDLASGTVTPSGPSGEPGTYQTPFTYAPDGTSRIAIESRQTERHPVITDADGVKLDLGVHHGGQFANSRGIDWAANNTILLVGAAGEPATLLTVARRP